MRILAVAPEGTILFPVGLAYIIAALKNAGHHVDALNLQLTGAKPIPRGYDFVAVGGLASQYDQLQDISSGARKAGAKLLLGGGIVTSEPELVTRNLRADYSVLGEGEETAPRLIDCLERGDDPESIPGIAFLRRGEFVSTGSSPPIEDLDSLPWPDLDSLGFSQYLDHIQGSSPVANSTAGSRPFPVVASRSCPFPCTFCYHPLGKKYRQRSIDSIMRELEACIPKYRINAVDILDELLSYDVDRLKLFCERIKQLSAKLSQPLGWGCQMRVDKINGELLDMLKDAGCGGMSFGFESYSPEILKSFRKSISTEQIHNAIHLTLDRKMVLQANFLLGDKAETKESIAETIDFWREHTDAGINLAFVIPAPDCELYRYSLKENIISDKLDFLRNLTKRFYNMTSLSMWDFIKLRTTLFKLQLQDFPHTLPVKIEECAVEADCPLCGARNTYENFLAKDDRFSFMGISLGRILYNIQVTCRSCVRRFFIRSLALCFIAPFLPIYVRVRTIIKHYGGTLITQKRRRWISIR